MRNLFTVHCDLLERTICRLLNNNKSSSNVHSLNPFNDIMCGHNIITRPSDKSRKMRIASSSSSGKSGLDAKLPYLYKIESRESESSVGRH